MSWELRGAAADFYASEDHEVLCEGGARTGKTHSFLVKAHDTALRYPGCRQLFARQTRVSMTGTVLPDWERKVVPQRYRLAFGKATPAARMLYRYPNGSEIDVLGLDNEDRILSAEYDRIYVFQAEEVTERAWETLLSRLSGRAARYRQIAADLNPAGARHWLNQRGGRRLCLQHGTDTKDEPCGVCGSTGAPVMRRLGYRHHHNPVLWDRGEWTEFGREYLGRVLGRLTGLQRKRLLEHQWVSEEGMILENWDPEVHMLTAELENDLARGWMLHVLGWPEPVRLEWFAAGCDWGYSPAPGVLQVWGYDARGRRFRVAEVYRTLWQLDQWAEVAEELQREFDLRYIACDPSRNDERATINRRISRWVGRHGVPVAIAADNTLRRQKPDLAGIDLMRWGLRDHKGVVRTFFVRDSLRYGIDKALRDAGHPTCTEEEIPSWTFRKNRQTDELEEKPDDRCDDHGLDAWRYEQAEGWGKHLAQKLATELYAPGTYGQVLRHQEKRAADRRKRNRSTLR